MRSDESVREFQHSYSKWIDTFHSFFLFDEYSDVASEVEGES